MVICVNLHGATIYIKKKLSKFATTYKKIALFSIPLHMNVFKNDLHKNVACDEGMRPNTRNYLKKKYIKNQAAQY